MGSWTIYSKNGVAKASVKELELHDEWMAECYLTLTINNATPIQFGVGDYIDYRGERYTIEYDPNFIKKATSGSYGNGFTYNDIKFVGSQDEIVRCDFNDIVLSDNNVHYTALPTFPFYCESVDDLLDRIQANLEDLYPGEWIVIGLNTVRNSQRGNIVGRQAAFENAYRTWVDPDLTPHTDPYGKQGVAETADNITCWDAMKKVHDDFGLNFIVRGKVVVVGTAGVFTANTFRYGKGNGLTEIERVSESDQQIVTRLRAYGSEQNLPQHYYANLNTQVFSHVSNVQKFSTNGCSFLIDLDFDSKYFTYRSEDYPGEPSSPNYIVELKANDVTVRGFVTRNSSSNACYIYCESVGSDDDRDEPDASKMAAFIAAISNGDRVDFVDYVNKDTFDSTHKDCATENLPDNMAVSRLMVPGFPNISLNAWVQAHKNDEDKQWLRDAIAEGITFSTEQYRPYIDSPNISQYGVRPASIYFDGSAETENIHPTIVDMEYGGVAIDSVYAADQVEDNGVFPAGEEVKNINITLPDLGFDLGSLYVDGATIDMTSGMCGARSFKIASKPKKDANNRWVCNVERVHDESLDLWFPYKDFQITSGDKYVLTGIALPDAYVDAAAIKLLQSSIDALKKNHAPRYTYQPRIDEIFMQRQHDTAVSSQGVVSLHDTLKAGDVFAFADNDLGIDASIIIDVLTIKENGNNGIPTYEVTLRNEKQVGTIQKITNKVDSIISGAINVNGGGSGLTPTQVRSLINNYGGEQFLSKLNNDEAHGFIRFIQGLQVGNQFVSGLLGEGGVFRKDADGKVYIEADKLYVRMRAYFDNVEIKNYEHTSGNRIASKAGLKCVKVEAYNANDVLLATNPQTEPTGTSYYRLYFRAKDGENTINNDFVNGDQAFCDKTTYDNNIISHHRYWRLVVGKNGNLSDTDEFGYIELSASDKESGSDVPQAGDDVSQLGNRTNTERQGAIIEFVGGDNAPAYQIYQGINTYSLSGKCMIDMGFDSQTGLARMNVAGNFRFGSPLNTGSYIKYDSQANQGQGELKIKAHVEFTNSDAELDALVQEHQTTYDDSAVWSEMDNLQDQIDGAIESWFLTGVPTLQNAPANTWTTDAEKNNHIGDLYYDKATGHGYRFMFDNEEEVYLWTPIADEDIARALENAAHAQATADGKSTTYLTRPSKYKAGDLWILQSDQTINGVSYKAGDVLTASTDSEAYSEAHWSKQVRYTDDTKADSILNNSYYQQLVGGTISQNITNAANAASAAQSTANAAQSDATAANNKLTTWADDTKISPTEKLALKNQKADVMKEYAQIITDAAKYTGVSTTAFTTAYNKAITAFNYYTASTPENIAIITDSQTDSDATPRYSRIADYYAARQTILEAITTAAKNYATTQGNKYLDDAVYRAISAALGSVTEIDGGLVLTSLIGMRQQNAGGTYTVWGGISGEYDDWSETHAKGHGIAAWYGGAMVDKEDVQTLPASYAKSLFRFDGSGYLAGGNITWDATGRVTIKDLHTDDGGTPTDVLQEMSAFREMFDLSVWSSATRIKPLQNFEQLKITRPSGYTITDNDVLTRNENDARYMLIDRFLELFDVYNGSTNYSATFKTSGLPTDRSNISIKAKFDFWSQGGITALGQGSQGGGGGGSTTLYGLNDVSPNASNNQVLGIVIEDGVTTTGDGYVLTFNGSTKHWYAAPTAPIYSAGTGLALSSNAFSINSTYQTYISHGESAYNSLGNYVKLSETEQTIVSTTSSMSKGVVEFYRSSSGNYPMISFANKDANGNKQTLGYIGFMSSVGSLVYRSPSGDFATIWHADNDGSGSGLDADLLDGQHGSYYATASSLNNYLPKSGGAMSGTISRAYSDNDQTPFLWVNGGNYDNYIWTVSDGGSSYTGFGFGLKYIGSGSGNENKLVLYADNQGGTKVAAYSVWNNGEISFAVTPKVGTDTIITSGTIGSQSVSYATSAGSASSASVLSSASIPENADINDYKTTGVYGQLQSNIIATFTNRPSTYSGGEMRLEVIGCGNNSNNNLFQKYWARSGDNWDLYIRTYYHGTGWTDWAKNIDSRNIGSQSVSYASSAGNATSATSATTATTASKLSTVSKTAWGQTYWTSGGVPDSISGAMTGVTTINNQLKIGDSSNTRLNIVEQGATINGVHIFVESHTSTYTYERPLILQYDYGNVGVGVIQPAYKLEVGGTFYASGNSSIGGSFGVTGATTLTGLLTANGGIAIASSKTLKIGDAYLSYDSTNNAIRVSKNADGTGAANFYAIGGVSALGASEGGGGGGQGDVTWALLANNSDERPIALSHLTGALTDYATKSWVGQQGYVTSSGVTSVATGTGLTGGTITSTGTISINSTYQTYISHGESAYNSLGNYLPKTGGAMTGGISRYFSSDDEAPLIWMKADRDNYIWTVSDGGDYTSYGFGLKYLGSGSGINNKLVLYADNSHSGTQVEAYSITNDGVITFGVTPKVGSYNVITAGTIGSQSVNYATSAGSVAWENVSSKPTTLSGYGITDGVYSTEVYEAQNNVTWAQGVADGGGLRFVYNTAGTEWSYIFGMKSSGNLGAVIKMGYSDRYLRILRKADSGWQSSDWETIFAGYADSAGSATKLQTARTIWGQSFDGSANVSGNMSGVGTINSRLNILNTFSAALLNIDCINQTGPAYLHIYVSSVNSDYATSRPLVLQNGYGSVGIGVTNPTHKLEVNGDVKATNFRGALVGNADTATSATTATIASKLSTVSKTAWGQTYWTDEGIPATISGAMTGVTTIDDYVSFTTRGSTLPVLNISTVPSNTDYVSIYVTATHRPLVLQLNAGNVGIGVAQPSYKLQVEGTFYTSNTATFGGDVLPASNMAQSLGSDSYRWEHIRGKFLWAKGPAPAVYVSNESGDWMALHWASDLNRGLYDSNNWIIGYNGTNTFMGGGNVGIGTSSPSYKLHVSGDIYATGGVTSLSDARHKTIMGNTKLRVEQIAEMPAITYKWIDRRDNDLHVGSIAQNWQRILPEVVSVANDLEGTLSINYGVAAMIASIVTAKKVVDHEARIKALEKENRELKEEIRKLKIA